MIYRREAYTMNTITPDVLSGIRQPMAVEEHECFDLWLLDAP